MRRGIPRPRVSGNIAYIPINKNHAAKVDAWALPALSGLRWRLIRSPNGKVMAATSSAHGAPRFMHRLVAGVPVHINVRHKNGDGLDNRICNLSWRKY